MNWENVQGYFDEFNRVEYDRLVSLVPDGSLMVEVGSFRGKSLASIAPTINRKKLLVWAVDLFDEANYNEPDVMLKRNGMCKDFMATMVEFGLSPKVTKGNSKQAVIEAPEKAPSLVFIDADHSYEAVKEDIE